MKTIYEHVKQKCRKTAENSGAPVSHSCQLLKQIINITWAQSPIRVAALKTTLHVQPVLCTEFQLRDQEKYAPPVGTYAKPFLFVIYINSPGIALVLLLMLIGWDVVGATWQKMSMASNITGTFSLKEALGALQGFLFFFCAELATA